MKILIGITACHSAIYPDAMERATPPNNALCPDASRATWIKDAVAAGVDVRFFYGRGATRPPLSDEVFLDVDDSYEGLIEKVTAMYRWAINQNYDFVLKIDVDSFVHVENFLASEFREWDYTGRGWGLGYILSKLAMRVVTETKFKKLSWAEDSHVLRALLLWGNKSPENKIRLYGDGRYVFLPNLVEPELALYAKNFIVANPMNPHSMKRLHSTGSLRSILPLQLSQADLWTMPPERISHGKLLGACAIVGCPSPVTFGAWQQLTAYQRQPYVDWISVVNACVETDKVESCPSLELWMGPLEGRKEILKWARDTNEAAEKTIAALSTKVAEAAAKEAAAGLQDFRLKQDTRIAIVSCKKFSGRVGLQRKGWIDAAVALGFNVDVFDGFRLGVPDDYVSLPLKTKALCKLTLEHGYKRLLKIDDDTHVVPTNLRIVTNDYAGIVMRANDLGLPEAKIPAFAPGTVKFNYASGGAYWLSEKAMKVIADAPITDWAEDRWVGQVLGKAGIFPALLPNYYIVSSRRGPAYITIADAQDTKDVTVLTQIYGEGH